MPKAKVDIRIQAVELEDRLRASLRLYASRAHKIAGVTMDDVVQEIHVRLTQTFPDGQADAEWRSGDRLFNWMRQVGITVQFQAINAALAQKRDARRVQSDEPFSWVTQRLAEDGSTPSSIVARRELHDLLHDAIAGLPETERRTLTKADLSEEKLSEVADENGKSLGSIRGTLFRARKRLRGALGNPSSLFGTWIGRRDGSANSDDPAT